MKQLQEVAPAFIEMTHRIVWTTAAAADAFAVLRLEPWRIRVFPGTVLAGEGEVLTWEKGDSV